MTSIVNDLFSTYKNGAKNRKLIFDLTTRDFEKLIRDDCFYCSASPIRKTSKFNHKTKKLDILIWNGIDRVDNKLGYEKENCVSCCWGCNKMKMDMSLEDFFIKISRIYNLHLKGENRGN